MCEPVLSEAELDIGYYGYCGDKQGDGCGANLLNATEEKKGHCHNHPACVRERDEFKKQYKQQAA